MKQTAVEWLVWKLSEIRQQNSGYRNIVIEYKNLINQAKAMEKEQIKEAYIMSLLDGDNKIRRDAEDYYNQTFKSERDDNQKNRL